MWRKTGTCPVCNHHSIGVRRRTVIYIKILAVVLYVIVMVSIGYFCMNKTKTVGDFFLGGRTLGPWLTAFTYGTTYFSAVLFIGYAGKLGWGFGLNTMWIVVGNAFIGVFLAFFVLGKRTRRLTARLNAMTMPEFLEARYDSKILKAISALIIFIFLVPYTSSVYMGLSYLFEVNLGISYLKALSFMAILTAVYLTMGGYLALAITDLVQGVIMLIGVFFMVGSLVGQHGGLIESTRQLMNPDFAPALKAPTAIPGWLTLTCLVIITSLGPFGLPQMVQKFYSIKNEKIIFTSMIVCTVVCFVMAFGAYYTGSLTHLFYQTLPSKNIDELVPRLLTDHTPQFIAIVILLLVISASMSTLSSLVLVSSSAIAIDLYGGFINPNASKRFIVLFMRFLCAFFIGLSLYIALKPPAVIVDLMVVSWGALAGSFIGPYVYGLYWKRTTKAGATVGMLTGVTIAVSLYKYLGQPGIALSGAVAMITPLLVVPIVSLLTKPYSAEHLDKVFGETPSEN